jgi:hypothetical protein
LLARTGRSDLVEQPCLDGARPGPGTYFTQAAVIDIDHNDSALCLMVRHDAPSEITGAVLHLLQYITGQQLQSSPGQHRSHEPKKCRTVTPQPAGP